MAPCATCGQTPREGDRFCMRCGAARKSSGGARTWEYARITARQADPGAGVQGERQSGGPARGTSDWVYEAVGEHSERGTYLVRRSPSFPLADVAFGPTFDWNGQLEGQDALTTLLAQLRDEGWELLANQEALDLVLSRVSSTGQLRAMGEALREEEPIWSQLRLRRAVAVP